MENNLTKSKNIIPVFVVIIMLVGLSAWEYQQYNSFKRLEKQIEIEQGPLPENLTTYSAVEISKPLQGVTSLSLENQRAIVDYIATKMAELRTSEVTTSRPSLLKEETWLDMTKFVERTGQIWCPISGNKANIGSAFFINEEGNILTNYHVVDGLVGNHCFVAIASEYRQPPDKIYRAYLTTRYNKDIDYAVLYIDKMVWPQEKEIVSRSFPYIRACDSNIVKLGDPIVVFGYPIYGGNPETNVATITGTDGIIAGSLGPLPKQTGFQTNHFKMTAKIDSGNSGGPVLIDDPRYECYIGIATFTVRAEIEQLYYAIKTRAISGYNW
jgi:S1-C subfamily serine protease